MTDTVSSIEAQLAPWMVASLKRLDLTQLADAIVDLVDNCVDGAKRQQAKNAQPSDSADEEGGVDLSGYTVEISLGDSFVITDNCGGIELGDALLKRLVPRRIRNVFGPQWRHAFVYLVRELGISAHSYCLSGHR